MYAKLSGLKGIEKNIAYLSSVEAKELHSLSSIYDQLVADKFELIEEVDRIKKIALQKVNSIEGEIEILTKEIKRIDGLRNEVIQLDFKDKNKIKKYA